MKRKVITMRDVNQLTAEGQTSICIDEQAILTPSVKDYLKTKGVEIRYTQPIQGGVSSDLAERIAQMVVSKYNISDPMIAAAIVEAALKQLK